MGVLNQKVSSIIIVLLLFLPLLSMAQEGTVKVNQNREIEVLLALKKDVNRSTSNFKIQIFNGNRVGAENAKGDFNKSYYKWPVTTVFETPNYKIWVGNFKTRLEADRALVEIKQNFPNAFIFKPTKKKKEP